MGADQRTKEFLRKTIAAWQPYSAELISMADAEIITNNMTALFSFLSVLNKKYPVQENKEVCL